MTDQIDPNELQAKLECMFADMGAQIGDVLRCMIEQEVASHVARLGQLQALLNGGCESPTSDSSNP
jgi:hypothetical protein